MPPFSINDYFFLMNGMSPGNHGNSEVAVDNATGFFFVFFVFEG